MQHLISAYRFTLRRWKAAGWLCIAVTAVLASSVTASAETPDASPDVSQTLVLPAAVDQIAPGGIATFIAVGESRRTLSLIDTATGKLKARLPLGGKIEALVPYAGRKDGWRLAVLMRDESGEASKDKYALVVISLEGGDLAVHNYPPDAIPNDFASPNIRALFGGQPDGSFLVWDQAVDDRKTYYRIVDAVSTRDIEMSSFRGWKDAFGKDYPPFEFLNIGSERFMLGLDRPPASRSFMDVRVIDVRDGYPLDAIFVEGISPRGVTNISAFVPDGPHGGTGDVIFASGEAAMLTILSLQAAERLPRIGYPIQIPLSTPRGVKLLLAATMDLSSILVGIEGSKDISIFRKLGGGLEAVGSIELDKPIKDIAVVSTGVNGDSRAFAFLYENGREVLIVSNIDRLREPDTEANVQPFSNTSLDSSEVERLQRALANFGYPVGVDGAIGPITAAALRGFQISVGIKGDGTLDEKTLDALNASLIDETFETLSEALNFFSTDRLEPVIGDDPEKFKHVPILVSTLYERGYRRRNVLTAILANVIFETSNLKVFEELGTGERYEGRTDLGNTQPGDGVQFKGRGYVMIVGRANYRRFGTEIGTDLEHEPALAAQPEIAAKVTAAYLAPQLDPQTSTLDLVAIRKMFNGSMQSIDHVGRLYTSLLQPLPVSQQSSER